MNRSVTRWVGAVTVLLLGLAGLALLPTRASALFSSSLAVSQTGYDSFEQRAVFDRHGNALLAWIRESHTYPHPRWVQVRSRTHAGVWGPILTLSPTSMAPRSPKVAVDDDGDAIVVWDALENDEFRVYARRVSRTGTLGTLRVLSATGVKIHGTDVAIDPDGDAVVTWAEWHDDGSVYPMMRRYTRSETLSAPTVLATSPARAETPAVGLDREGDAVLAWTNDNVVQARTLSAAGTLGPLFTASGNVSPIDRHFTAKVAINRYGDALLTWEHWTAADQSTQIWGRWVSRAGVVGAVRQLTLAWHPDVSNYSVASDLDGDVMLVWDRFPSQYTYGRLITRTGTLGQPVLVTSYGRFPTVRVDDDGDGVVVWQGQGMSGSTGSIRGRRVTQSGTYGAVQVITSIGVNPTAAVTPIGGALVAWERMFMVDKRILTSIGP